MKNFFVTLLFFACFQGLAQKHATFNSELSKAFEKIAELRFTEARQIVEEQTKADPQNRVTDYLNAAMLCIELFVNEDEEQFEKSKTRIDEAILRIEALNEEEPYRNLFLGELYIAQAILNGKFDNKIPAAWQFYKSYNYLTTNYRKYPEFMPTYISLGVLYAAIGSLPDNYQSMASLLGFEGSVEKGLSMLKRSYYQLAVDHEKKFYQPYAGFVYSFANFQLNPGHIISPENLGLETAGSSFLIYLQAQIELETGNPVEAVKWLDKRPMGNQYLDFHYLDYLQGKILLGLEPERAHNFFKKYLQGSGSEVYIKSSYRYLSWYHLLNGDQSKAKEMRDMVFKKGTAHTGADRQALAEAGRAFNKTLIHARVLFDAAKYDEAEEVLQNNPIEKCCKSADEMVEYHYRMGRILQQKDRLKAAASALAKGLEIPNAQATYALGNSALQMAIISEETGDIAQARKYYRKTLGISGYPFYEGIHQKAKAGLARVSKT